jgi:phosphoribosylglycinamide formyltransferase-1
MYGMHVHNAVIQEKELESGITIHYVNGVYDEGQIIKQFRISISDKETPETLSRKVRALEHEHFSDTVAQLIMSNKV